MKQLKWLMGPAALAIALGVTGTVVHAQPDPGGAPVGENPPNDPQRPDFRNMTPEQRQQMMQQAREQMLRRTLDNSGFTSRPVQDAVVAFVKAQEQATLPLQEQSRRLIEAVSTPGIPEAQVATLLTNFQTAVAAEKARRQAARAALDAKINYSKQPRLAVLLTAMGFIGDETAMLRGIGGGMMGGPGGFGGPGGRGGFGGGPGGADGGFGPGRREQ